LSHGTPPAIDARGIWKRYPGVWALRAVDLRVEAGEGVCLVGANGSGKTTLLKILATAANPTRGDAQVAGASIRRDPDTVRERVGLFVPQGYVYGELTALENLRFAARMYGLALGDAALTDRLATVGLARAADVRTRSFSQGMLQRLALARATLREADVMLLDEPYTALDPAGQDLIDDVLRALRATGRSMMIATHLVERALAHCDRGIAMEGGRIVYDGPAAGLPLAPTAERV
jgi:heme exporter protein A